MTVRRDKRCGHKLRPLAKRLNAADKDRRRERLARRKYRAGR